MLVFFSWVHLEQSDSDMPLHMSIHYQGYYVWLVFNRSCFNYSDLCSDNRIYSRIKMMSGLSNFSKYIRKEENALFSRTKSKFTVLHEVFAINDSVFWSSLGKGSLCLLQILESHLLHLTTKKCLCWFSCDNRFLI